MKSWGFHPPTKDSESFHLGVGMVTGNLRFSQAPQVIVTRSWRRGNSKGPWEVAEGRREEYSSWPPILKVLHSSTNINCFFLTLRPRDRLLNLICIYVMPGEKKKNQNGSLTSSPLTRTTFPPDCNSTFLQSLNVLHAPLGFVPLDSCSCWFLSTLVV